MVLLWLLAAPVHVPQVFAGPREAGIQNTTLFHIVGCVITEQYLAAGISIVRDFRRSPCVQVNQPLCLVEPCFRLGLIAFVESLVNARRKMRILGSGFDGRDV